MCCYFLDSLDTSWQNDPLSAWIGSASPFQLLCQYCNLILSGLSRLLFSGNSITTRLILRGSPHLRECALSFSSLANKLNGAASNN